MLLLLKKNSAYSKNISYAVWRVKEAHQEVIVRFLSNFLNNHIFDSFFFVGIVDKFYLGTYLSFMKIAHNHWINILSFDFFHLKLVPENFDSLLRKYKSVLRFINPICIVSEKFMEHYICNDIFFSLTVQSDFRDIIWNYCISHQTRAQFCQDIKTEQGWKARIVQWISLFYSLENLNERIRNNNIILLEQPICCPHLRCKPMLYE